MESVSRRSLHIFLKDNVTAIKDGLDLRVIKVSAFVTILYNFRPFLFNENPRFLSCLKSVRLHLAVLFLFNSYMDRFISRKIRSPKVNVFRNTPRKRPDIICHFFNFVLFLLPFYRMLLRRLSCFDVETVVTIEY